MIEGVGSIVADNRYQELQRDNFKERPAEMETNGATHETKKDTHLVSQPVKEIFPPGESKNDRLEEVKKEIRDNSNLKDDGETNNLKSIEIGTIINEIV